MKRRKARFTCQKCGAVHVFSETEDGFEVELEEEEEEPTEKKRGGGDFFGWMLGREKEGE